MKILTKIPKLPKFVSVICASVVALATYVEKNPSSLDFLPTHDAKVAGNICVVILQMVALGGTLLGHSLGNDPATPNSDNVDQGTPNINN